MIKRSVTLGIALLATFSAVSGSGCGGWGNVEAAQARQPRVGMVLPLESAAGASVLPRLEEVAQAAGLSLRVQYAGTGRERALKQAYVFLRQGVEGLIVPSNLFSLAGGPNGEVVGANVAMPDGSMERRESQLETLSDGGFVETEAVAALQRMAGRLTAPEKLEQPQ